MPCVPANPAAQDGYATDELLIEAHREGNMECAVCNATRQQAYDGGVGSGEADELGPKKKGRRATPPIANKLRETIDEHPNAKVHFHDRRKEFILAKKHRECNLISSKKTNLNCLVKKHKEYVRGYVLGVQADTMQKFLNDKKVTGAGA